MIFNISNSADDPKRTAGMLAAAFRMSPDGEPTEDSKGA